MVNDWKKDGKNFLKETNDEFMAITYMTFVNNEDDKYIYCPALHKLSKAHYPLNSINEIAISMFDKKAQSMSLSHKIAFLSPYIGSCNDIEDVNGERICFSFENNKEASDSEIEEKIISIIKELNL